MLFVGGRWVWFDALLYGDVYHGTYSGYFITFGALTFEVKVSIRVGRFGVSVGDYVGGVEIDGGAGKVYSIVDAKFMSKFQYRVIFKMFFQIVKKHFTILFY